ncbi:hypothetical protein HOD96_00925 [Candidatus Falkowbacteria bacterium]|jgi:hypothetical protein|nr:hypothetical protein [Candidatus Falkowbacteria bacterium]MBT4433178.1 hypothetical protein [Candidatus Falkowbacteria bacterium]
MIKTKKFLVTYPKEENICKIIIPQSENEVNTLKGKIFAVINCKKNNENNELINFLDQQINKYYNSIFLKLNSRETEKSFEGFLYNLNYNFQNLLEEKQISINLEEINLSIGVMSLDNSGLKYHLYFSQIGALESVLIYQTKNNKDNIAQIKDSTDEDGKIKPTKIFSNIINGKIKVNSSLVFCTENVLDYLNLDKLKEVVGKLNVSKAAKQTESLLLETNDEQIFGGVIIKVLPSTNIVEEKGEKKEQKKKEENITVFQYADKKEKATQQKSKLRFLTKTVKIMKFFLVRLLQIIKFILSGKIFKKTKEIIKNILKKIIALPKNYKSLPWLRKTLLVCSIVLVIFFIGSIVQVKNEKIKQENFKLYQTLLTQIDEKKIELESSLIYSDPSKSSAILLSLENLINKLPQDSEEQKTKLKEIKEQIKKLSFKTKLIEEIISPRELADYSKINGSQISNIVQSEDFIYSLNQNNIFSKLNLSDLSINKIDRADINLPLPISIASNKDTFVVLHENNNLSKFNKKDNKFFPLDIKFREGEVSLAAVTMYGDKLYTLDKANNQIYKHLPSGENFSVGKSWLNEDVDLKKSSSMAIDGSIYILNIDGTIINLFKGKKRSFNFSNQSSLLTGPEKIWTNSESDYLYILDVAGKKVAVIDKKGELIIQYYSEDFTDIKDFTIDENNKKIYLLANNKVFEIEVTHLD